MPTTNARLGLDIPAFCFSELTSSRNDIENPLNLLVTSLGGKCNADLLLNDNKGHKKKQSISHLKALLKSIKNVLCVQIGEFYMTDRNRYVFQLSAMLLQPIHPWEDLLPLQEL